MERHAIVVSAAVNPVVPSARVVRRPFLAVSLLLGGLSVPVAWTAPELWWVGVGALGLLLLVLFIGTANIRSGVFLDTFHVGRRDGAEVALTFDDGPDPEWTPRVLALLAERKFRATFFLVGRRVEANPLLVADILAAGHEIGLHTYDHAMSYPFRTPWSVRRDIERGREALRLAGAPDPLWFRPPNGLITPAIAQEVARAGLRVAGWTVRPRDGVRVDPAVVVSRVTGSVRGGDIVLLHDARSPYGNRDDVPGVEALPAILDALQARKLRCVTVGELERLAGDLVGARREGWRAPRAMM